MKKTVIDITDLQKLNPIFKNKLVVFITNQIFKWLKISKVNLIHSKYSHLRGAEFTSAMLSDPMMDVKYTIFNSNRLDSLPSGAFITVSNHPIGSLDGIILIDIFASRRKDFRVMVNGVLEKIGAMSDNFISVTPKTEDKSNPNLKNVNGVRLSLSWLKEGHPMGFFPAGAMSFFNNKKQVRDLPWTHSVIRLIRKANVPVYPVFFDCQNSNFFYRLGQLSWKIRTLRVPSEAFNKKGKNLKVYIGNPIAPEIIQQFSDDEKLAEFLYNSTYQSK